MKKVFLSVWGLAFCYFIFYVPYSAMTKALSQGLFSGSIFSISGFEMLPTVLFGTLIGFVAILLTTGWWKYAGTIKLFGIKIPFATNKYTFLSGICSAVIIATTTLAYSFTGISIVFAALLMRGGVLLLAVFVDTAYRRKIRLFSWIAFGLTLFSLMLMFSEKVGFKMSIAATINIAAYLGGYFFRLQFMTYTAKINDHNSTYKYFVEELLSVMLFIFILPLLFAIAGSGEVMLALRAGYVDFLSSGLVIPALIIGFLYSGLYIFGSRIYLDHRENTFCIPINRCASLLAAVLGSVVLTLVFKKQYYTSIQLVSAGILIVAILVLYVPNLISRLQDVGLVAEQYYIFVCPGNTGRSPMARLICIHHIRKHLQASGTEQKLKNIRIMSAGINAEEGRPMDNNAQLALKRLGIPVEEHKSAKLSAENIMLAKKIWCMSVEHRQLILDRFPEALEKLYCLDDYEPIPVPHGKGLEAYIDCAKRLEHSVELIVEREIAFV